MISAWGVEHGEDVSKGLNPIAGLKSLRGAQKARVFARGVNAGKAEIPAKPIGTNFAREKPVRAMPAIMPSSKKSFAAGRDQGQAIGHAANTRRTKMFGESAPPSIFGH